MDTILFIHVCRKALNFLAAADTRARGLYTP